MQSPDQPAVAAVLAEARKAAGLTQRDVARLLQKTPSYVARIETGDRRVDLIEFVEIARALGQDEADLFRLVVACIGRSEG